MMEKDKMKTSKKTMYARFAVIQPTADLSVTSAPTVA